MTTKQDKVRALIAEDHEIVRTGLKLLFNNWDDMEVAGEATNGQEAVSRAGLIRPDIILMDVTMPLMDGIEASKTIRSKYKDMKIIMLTSDRTEATVLAALSAGANGYCLKDVSPERLHSGIRCVVEGDLWLDSEVASVIVKSMNSSNAVSSGLDANAEVSRSSSTDHNKGDLSERELEVLVSIVDGLTNREIAGKLSISIDTVKTHIRHIMEKLSVSDRTQAAVKAIRENII